MWSELKNIFCEKWVFCKCVTLNLIYAFWRLNGHPTGCKSCAANVKTSVWHLSFCLVSATLISFDRCRWHPQRHYHYHCCYHYRYLLLDMSVHHRYQFVNLLPSLLYSIYLFFYSKPSFIAFLFAFWPFYQKGIICFATDLKSVCLITSSAF